MNLDWQTLDSPYFENFGQLRGPATQVWEGPTDVLHFKNLTTWMGWFPSKKHSHCKYILQDMNLNGMVPIKKLFVLWPRLQHIAAGHREGPSVVIHQKKTDN